MYLEEATVRGQTLLSGGYRVLTLVSPRIAGCAQPGQFVHLRVPRCPERLLRRPFSIFRVEESTLDLLYKPVGVGTSAMTLLQDGEQVSLLGPLGQGFPRELSGRWPVLVAGGYGVAPLFFLATRLDTQGEVFIGGRTAEDILCVADFEALHWRIHVTTEDGSLGLTGQVVDALDGWLEARGDGQGTEWFACGPEGLLRAVGERAVAWRARAWLSLDRRMGCGVGACLSCVQRVRVGDAGSRWARVCREGPVFEATQVVWETEGARENGIPLG